MRIWRGVGGRYAGRVFGPVIIARMSAIPEPALALEKPHM